MSGPKHLCPGSRAQVAKRGPGEHECPECKRFVILLNNGRLGIHRREFDRHTPFNDDGVTYCGWWGDVGIIDGCGALYPCESAANPTEGLVR